MSKVSCKFCGVICLSPGALCEHVLGQKHKMLVAQDFPGTVEELGRLQYFIDTYMEDWPVLGVEYVLETQTSSSYRYTCELCKKELDWWAMVYHIFDRNHMEAYLSQHGFLLNHEYYAMTKKEQYLRLKKHARDIQLKHGRKKIRTKESDTSDLLPAEAGTPHEECSKANGAHLGPSQGKELATEGSKENGFVPTGPVHHCSLCGVDSMSFVELSKHVMSAQHRQHVKDMKPNRYKTYCTLCSVTCSSLVALSEHIAGSKHRLNMTESGHSEQWEVGRLGHFLDAFMPEEPILGLEYIVERKLNWYQYNCKLCEVDVRMPKMVAHLKDVVHLKCYLQENHLDMVKDLSSISLTSEEFFRLLKQMALKILDREWCKVYGTPVAGDSCWREDSARKSDDLPSSRHDDGKGSQYQRRTSPHPEENQDNYGSRTTLTQPGVDGPSLAKWRKPLPEEDFKALINSAMNSPPLLKSDRLLPKQKAAALPNPNIGASPLYKRERLLAKQELKTLPKPAIDGPPLAKRERLLPKHLKALSSTPHTYKDPHCDESHVMELQVPPAMEELEFLNNQQFFEYLAHFKIKDYNDVVLIQKITQNCNKALKRFQKEETERLSLGHEQEAPVVNTSRVDQEILDTSVKPKSSPLASKTISPQNTFNTPLEPPKNKVIEDFFSSLKYMDVSDVVRFFQKIATTNPAFQGMDIPAVIRYLKASGRLKKP